MIIECKSCHARFRLDETKIRGKGARVKCRRCGDSIIVLKEGGPDAPSVQGPAASPPPGNLIPFPVPARGPVPAGGEPPAPGPAEALAGGGGAPLPREIPGEKDDVDLAFERILARAEESPTPEIPPPPAAEETGALPEEPESPLLPGLPETPEPPPSFRGEEGFLISDSETLDFLKEGPAAAPSSDISPHLSETPMNTDAASLRIPYPPEVPRTEEPAAAAVLVEISIERNETPPTYVAEPEAATLREESPPPSTAEPRFPEREEPAPSRGVSKALIAGAGLAALLLAGVGYFGFTSSGRQTIESVVPGAAGIWGGKSVAKAGPQYDVRNVIGYYETGANGKRILVIKGQVTNLSAKEKSGIRIAATILDSADKPLAEQMVYAGNTISGEMLRKAGRETIQKELANRFGDQLTNMNVAPGKSLPFMVVFFDAPENMDSYRLEAKDDQ